MLGDQRVADRGVIHDAFLGDAQRRHAAHVRLDLAHLVAARASAGLRGRWRRRASPGRAGAALRSRRRPPPACRRSRAGSRSPGRTPPSGGCPQPPGAPSPIRACSTARSAARRCCGRSGAGPRRPLFRARRRGRRGTAPTGEGRGQPDDAAADDGYVARIETAHETGYCSVPSGWEMEMRTRVGMRGWRGRHKPNCGEYPRVIIAS